MKLLRYVGNKQIFIDTELSWDIFKSKKVTQKNKEFKDFSH